MCTVHAFALGEMELRLLLFSMLIVKCEDCVVALLLQMKVNQLSAVDWYWPYAIAAVHCKCSRIVRKRDNL